MEKEWIMALIGGGLIGAASTIMLLMNGRITGISGIFAGILRPVKNEVQWRVMFVLGLVVSGVVFLLSEPAAFENTVDRPIWLVSVAGLLVGFGTNLGGGCTSGHGICGISRLSPRSLVATITFILAGIITVYLTKMIMGDAS